MQYEDEDEDDTDTDADLLDITEEDFEQALAEVRDAAFRKGLEAGKRAQREETLGLLEFATEMNGSGKATVAALRKAWTPEQAAKHPHGEHGHFERTLKHAEIAELKGKLRDHHEKEAREMEAQVAKAKAAIERELKAGTPESDGLIQMTRSLIAQLEAFARERRELAAETKKKALDPPDDDSDADDTDLHTPSDDDLARELLLHATEYARDCAHAGDDCQGVLDALADLADDPDRLRSVLEGTVEKAAPWNSDLHPRDDGGRFVSRESIHAAKSDPKLAKQLRKRVTDPGERKKLENALSGESDIGHTARSKQRADTAAKREKVTADRDAARAIRDRLFAQKQHGLPLAADDLRELVPHLSTMSHAELTNLRIFLGGKDGASFGGATRLAERRERVIAWAQKTALESRMDEHGFSEEEKDGAREAVGAKEKPQEEEGKDEPTRVEKPEAKEPHELTRVEWDRERDRLSFDPSGNSGGDQNPEFSLGRTRSDQGTRRVLEARAAHLKKLYGDVPSSGWTRYDENDKPYFSTTAPKRGDQDYDDARQIYTPHEQVVAAALAAGKPVPPEVLADYPDLAKPAPATPEGGFAPSWSAAGKRRAKEAAASTDPETGTPAADSAPPAASGDNAGAPAAKQGVPTDLAAHIHDIAREMMAGNPKYAARRDVPIPRIRDEIQKRFGEEAAGKAFDEAMLYELRNKGHGDLTPVDVGNQVAHEDRERGIRAVGDNFQFYGPPTQGTVISPGDKVEFGAGPAKTTAPAANTTAGGPDVNATAEAKPAPVPGSSGAATRARPRRRSSRRRVGRGNPPRQPKPRKLKGVSDKPTGTMTAKEINKELDALREHSSGFADEMIAAGRGHETASDYRDKADELSAHGNRIGKRFSELYGEIGVRYGPGAPGRLPEKGFGPREKPE